MVKIYKMLESKSLCIIDQSRIEEIRSEIVDHKLYDKIYDIDNLRRFAENHIFAIWDFMSLLKALQRELSCVSLPWTPKGDKMTRRLINDIVVEEESDCIDGEYMSHFELYLDAMEELGADSSKINLFIDLLNEGQPVDYALECSCAPKAAQEFVKSTWQIINSRQVHKIAAAFTFGREGIIPDMFQEFLDHLSTNYNSETRLLRKYLERHIVLDGEDHYPKAMQMLENLCAGDKQKHQDCAEIGAEALAARLEFWDQIAIRLH